MLYNSFYKCESKLYDELYDRLFLRLRVIKYYIPHSEYSYG